MARVRLWYMWWCVFTRPGVTRGPRASMVSPADSSSARGSSAVGPIHSITLSLTNSDASFSSRPCDGSAWSKVAMQVALCISRVFMSLQPVVRFGVGLLQVLDEKPHLGGQVPLLRVHGQDVVGGQGELVEHGHQITALQLRLDLPGAAPAQAHAFAHPAVQQLAVVAIQVAIHAHRHRLASVLEIPAALLTPLQVEG